MGEVNPNLKQLKKNIKTVIKDFTMDELLESLKIIRRKNHDKIVDYLKEKVKSDVEYLKKVMDKFSERYPNLFDCVDLSKIYTKIIGSEEHKTFIRVYMGVEDCGENHTGYFYEKFQDMCGFNDIYIYRYNKREYIFSPNDKSIYEYIFSAFDEIIDLSFNRDKYGNEYIKGYEYIKTILREYSMENN